jgi:phosphoglycerate dehydrogenase-like enzyme
MKIVIPDHIEISSEAAESIRRLPVQMYNDIPNEAEIIDRIKYAEIITANYIDITPKIIDAAPKLKYIIVPAVGYEWVDYKYATTKGIKVLNCPTFNSQAVAELAISLMFAVGRKIVEANTSLRNGEWQAARFKGFELSGKKLGLIGYGNIGKRIARMAEGIGMTVGYTNSKSSSAEIDKLFKESDVVTLCLPLNADTKGLVDAKRLTMLKSNAILINVARGPIIDQQALIEMLKSGKVAGAGLDVFNDEPLVGTPPQSIVELTKLPNVVATPHYGFNTVETAKRLGDELYENIKSCMDDAPINLVS